MSLEDALERAVSVELVVDARGAPGRVDERFECTLSVLRPAGFLLLIRSREFTVSWGLSSC